MRLMSAVSSGVLCTPLPLSWQGDVVCSRPKLSDTEPGEVMFGSILLVKTVLKEAFELRRGILPLPLPLPLAAG